MANTNFAMGGSHGLYYIKEVTPGVTPATPEMREMRHTSCSLVVTSESIQSKELRTDSQIPDLRTVSQQSSGDIGIELSFSAFDDIIASAVRGEWKAEDTDMVLINGKTRDSYTFERHFSDIVQYQVFTGCRINTLNLSFKINDMITGSFGIVGEKSRIAQVPLDETPIPSPAFETYTAQVGSLKEGGLLNAIVTGIDLSIDNQITPDFVLFTKDAVKVSPRRMNITGTINAYFEDLKLMDKFLKESESSLDITVGTGTSTTYKISLPRIKYTGAENSASSEDNIILNMPFQVLYDKTLKYTIKIIKVV